MARKRYFAGQVFLPGLQCNERWSEGNLGFIVIGGDRGDVHATSATNETVDGEAGVMLVDVDFRTTLDIDEETVVDEVDEVVRACYDSIQEETFIQNKKER